MHIAYAEAICISIVSITVQKKNMDPHTAQISSNIIMGIGLEGQKGHLPLQLSWNLTLDIKFNLWRCMDKID